MQQAIKNTDLEARRQFRLGLLAGLILGLAVATSAWFIGAITYV